MGLTSSEGGHGALTKTRPIGARLMGQAGQAHRARTHTSTIRPLLLTGVVTCTHRVAVRTAGTSPAPRFRGFHQAKAGSSWVAAAALRAGHQGRGFTVPGGAERH